MTGFLLRCMSQLLALFVESLQCTNSGATGGTADMDRPPAPIASEAYDPEPTLNSEDFAQRTMAAAVAAKE
jgi:hypothetical protein